MVKLFGLAALCSAAALASYEPLAMGVSAGEIHHAESSPVMMNLAQKQASSKQKRSKTFGLMSSSSLKGSLVVGSRKQSFRGRLNLVVKASDAEIRAGQLPVEVFTISANSRSQGGLVAFSSRPGNSLKYDAKTQTLSGRLNGEVETTKLSNIILSKKDHIVKTPKQSASVQLSIKLSKPLERIKGSKKLDLNGSVRVALSARGLSRYSAPALSLTSFSTLPFDFFRWYNFQLTKKLCVQPIKLKDSANDRSPTGSGLNFGARGLRHQWERFGVIFEARPWKTLVEPDLKVLSTQAEKDRLWGKVNDSDCIEVYFIENFDPADDHGGGFAGPLGAANAKVVSSDGNNNGIDRTHLAHELGHVMGLDHPNSGSGAGWTSGNTGTLMCGSGFRRDNPTRNSTQNLDNISNPLFRYGLRVIKPGSGRADCNDNSDCGSCAQHMN